MRSKLLWAFLSFLSAFCVQQATAQTVNLTTGNIAYLINGVPITLSGGQLQYGGSTTLNYCPYKGNLKTTASQGIYTIPSSCLTATITSMYVGGVAGGSLSANTLYYIYLWNNSGTWVLDAETTGHATNTTTGIEQMSGDATKTLVGMVYPQSGPVLVDSTTARLVATWDSRTPKYLSNHFTVNRSTTSATAVEINSEIRGQFLSWGDSFNVSYYGAGGVLTSSAQYTSLITLDGTTTVIADMTTAAPGVSLVVSPCTSANYSTSEGEHYVTIAGYISTGTGIWYYSDPPSGLTWSGVI